MCTCNLSRPPRHQNGGVRRLWHRRIKPFKAVIVCLKHGKTFEQTSILTNLSGFLMPDAKLSGLLSPKGGVNASEAV